MDYFALMLLEARRAEMQYGEKQHWLALHSYQGRRRWPWIASLSTLVVLAIVIWYLL